MVLRPCCPHFWRVQIFQFQLRAVFRFVVATTCIACVNESEVFNGAEETSLLISSSQDKWSM